MLSSTGVCGTRPPRQARHSAPWAPLLPRGQRHMWKNLVRTPRTAWLTSRASTLLARSVLPPHQGHSLPCRVWPNQPSTGRQSLCVFYLDLPQTSSTMLAGSLVLAKQRAARPDNCSMSTVIDGGIGPCETATDSPPTIARARHLQAVILVDARTPMLVDAHAPEMTTRAPLHFCQRRCALRPHGRTQRVPTSTPCHTPGRHRAEHINRATAHRIGITSGVAR